MEREENGIDPNRDFPFAQEPDKCMRTFVGRALNEVWLEHLFQLAITFHGGMQAIAYEWGSPNHEVWCSVCCPCVDVGVGEVRVPTHLGDGGGWGVGGTVLAPSPSAAPWTHTHTPRLPGVATCPWPPLSTPPHTTSPHSMATHPAPRPWSASHHALHQSHESESPDDTAQAVIAGRLSAYAGAFKEGPYEFGRLNPTV